MSWRNRTDARAKPPFALLLLSAFLAGCSGLLESNEPPDSVWWLEPPALPVAQGTGTALVLQVTAVPGLDTDRILNLNDDRRLNHYAGAHWAEHTPELLDSLLRRSLEAGESFGPVRSGDYARAQECLLSIELRKFFGHLDSARNTTSVSVELAGMLVCEGQTQTLGGSARVPVGDNRMSDIVSAFQAALDEALPELVRGLDAG